MRPLMRARGVRFTYTAKKPSGEEEVLLDVNPYTFRWTTEYQPLIPINLPASTMIECRAIMDNSHENVRNPQPHDEVRPGETMSDEIIIGWVDYVIGPTD